MIYKDIKHVKFVTINIYNYYKKERIISLILC